MLKSFIAINRSASEFLARKFPGFFGMPVTDTEELLTRINQSIETRDIQDILEVGGIDRPLLEKSDKYNYVGLDIESKDQCYEKYDEFIVQSIENPLNAKFDMIISITLLEHVPNNRASSKTMFEALNSGGIMHHYVPSKWHPYSIALRVIGPNLQKKLIKVLRPAAVGVTGYPAFFNYCSVAQMKRLFQNAGFTEIDVQPFYRANDYFAFFLPLFILDSAFENFCKALNLSMFCSGYIISATRS